MNRVSETDTERKRAAKIRAGFVAQGTSLCAWCQAQGIAPTNAYKALAGRWTGPKASALVERMERAAGVRA